MSHQLYDRIFRVGDRIRFGIVALDENGNIINLTGTTLTLRYKIGSAAAVEVGMTIVDAPAGKAERLETLSSAGDISWEYKLVDALSNPCHAPEKPRFGKIIPILA